MAISPLALSALLQTSALRPLSGATTSAVDPLVQQIFGTQVSLSSFGRLQSVASGVADAAAGLRASERDGAALRGAVERFVAAVNTGGRVVENVLLGRLAGSVAGFGVLTDDTAALQATGELLRGVDDPARNGGVELGVLGISREGDGQLRFDTEVFNRAVAADPEGVAAALDTVGATVLGAATSELSAGGRLNAATTTFDFLIANLQLQQIGLGTGANNPLLAADSSLLLLSNPFFFRGVDAFRLIAGL